MVSGARSTEAIIARARLAAAWAVGLAVVAVGALAAFCGVDARARSTFEEHRRTAPAARSVIGAVVGSVAVADDVVIRQEFDAPADGLKGLRLRTVTWGAVPDDYSCGWSLVEVAADGELVPHPVEVHEILWLSLEEMLAEPTLLSGNREFLEAVLAGRVRL